MRALDDLDAIEARYDESSPPGNETSVWDSRCDVAPLVAEVKRLRIALEKAEALMAASTCFRFELPNGGNITAERKQYGGSWAVWRRNYPDGPGWTERYETFAFLYSRIVDRTLVTRVEYDRLLRASAHVYRENMRLRTRLRELERLASSWTGTPERSPEIVRAREALREDGRA
jgi:hypothetical protein